MTRFIEYEFSSETVGKYTVEEASINGATSDQIAQNLSNGAITVEKGKTICGDSGG